MKHQDPMLMMVKVDAPLETTIYLSLTPFLQSLKFVWGVSLDSSVFLWQ